MWQGVLALKNDQCVVQLHMINGFEQLVKLSLPQQGPDGSVQPLRIAQRMRLEPAQLDGVIKRMKVNILNLRNIKELGNSNMWLHIPVLKSRVICFYVDLSFPFLFMPLVWQWLLYAAGFTLWKRPWSHHWADESDDHWIYSVPAAETSGWDSQCSWARDPAGNGS